MGWGKKEMKNDSEKLKGLPESMIWKYGVGLSGSMIPKYGVGLEVYPRNMEEWIISLPFRKKSMIQKL